jgi:hypothetical protein
VPHLLDLPSAGVGKDQRPEIINGGDRFIGEQIPRQQIVIAEAYDQPERLIGQRRIRVMDGNGQHLQLDGALLAGIPSGDLRPSPQVSG